MRINGTLTSWNAQRGFGFISPQAGGPQVFVHISSFPRNGRPPQLGESLSFEIQLQADGKQRAIQLQRPGERPAPASSNRGGSLTAIVLGAALGAGALFHFRPAEPLSGRTQTIPVPPTPLRQPATNFVCDGRIYCSQMHSCEEATYFLQKCPGVEMDGEGDGIPCEQQWCH